MARVVADDERYVAAPPVSSRTRWATYKPDTASDGTVHEADTAQFPQSMRPVGPLSLRHSGWDLRERGGRLHARNDLAGAVALVVADPQDVNVVRRRRGV